MRFVKREKRGDVVTRLADMADLGREVCDRESGGKTAALPKGDTPLFFVCVAGKGLAGGRICMCGSERSYG